jgi:peptidoglycan hydrolase-like protein with peptidoglycan-binding domain
LTIPKNFKINIIDAVVVKKEELPQINNINIVLAKQGDKSEYIKDLQKMLIKKGFDIKADGDFGKKTEQAVWDFQKNNKLKETKVFDTETLLVLMS